MSSAWVLLIVAVVTEISWGCSLKAISYYSLGKIFIAVPFLLSCINMWLLAVVMRSLPAGLTYVIWTTLGSIGILLFGLFFFQESLTKMQLFFALLCLIGIAGLKFCSRA